jgi:hypothetical protein
MMVNGRIEMDDCIVRGPVAMPRGSLLRIVDGRGILVRVLNGVVWITQDGSSADHVLQPGEKFRLDRDGLAIVQAFRRSALTLMAPEPERFACRIFPLANWG